VCPEGKEGSGCCGSEKDPKQPTTGRPTTLHWRNGEGLEVFTALPILNIGKISRPGVETSARSPGHFLLFGKDPVRINTVGLDSSVGITTRYGLYGPGIESWWGAKFFVPVRNGPRAHPASYKMGRGSFPGVKRPRRGVNHAPPSSAGVKKRVGLYFCSYFGPSLPVIG
jgi:hypothetical protein